MHGETAESQSRPCWGDKIRLTDKTNMSPRAVGRSSCARLSFNPKPLLRMSYNLMHGGTHKFPRTKHIWSPQQVPRVSSLLYLPLLRRQRKEEQSLFQSSNQVPRVPRFGFGPIPQGRNAELDFAEKKFCEFREFRVMDLAVFGQINKNKNPNANTKTNFYLATSTQRASHVRLSDWDFLTLSLLILLTPKTTPYCFCFN